MKFKSDIDIDFADREQALSLIKHHAAVIERDGKMVRHNTGIYVTDIPSDPFTNTAGIDHKVAEDRGYIKLDFLNVGVYSHVRDNQHLDELMVKEPDWTKLYDPDFCSQVIHIGNHYNTLIDMPEAVNTIPRMAMFLAVIRPGKRHLVGKTWKEVGQTVWERPEDDSYFFKKAHAVAYAHLVAVHMNILADLTNKSNTAAL
jgi:hypothetical protein